LGGLKITKGELGVKEIFHAGIFHAISGVWVGEFFRGDWRKLGIEVGRGIFNLWGRLLRPF
jgi:hypothetical protein